MDTHARMAWWIRISGERRPFTDSEVGTSQKNIIPDSTDASQRQVDEGDRIFARGIIGEAGPNHHPIAPTVEIISIRGNATKVWAR